MKICRVEEKREVVDVKYEVCDEYCCNKMKEWLNIASYPSRNIMLYNTKTGRYTFEVREASGDYSCGSDSSVYEEMIYCPFCGTKLQEPKPIVKAKKSWRKKK